MKPPVLLVPVCLVLALGVVMARPSLAQPRGPVSFSSIDADGNGVITRAEFDKFRARRQQQAARQGRLMRNAGRRASFAMLDANGDGKISRQEFDRFRAQRMKQRMKQRMRQTK